MKLWALLLSLALHASILPLIILDDGTGRDQAPPGVVTVQLIPPTSLEQPEPDPPPRPVIDPAAEPEPEPEPILEPELEPDLRPEPRVLPDPWRVPAAPAPVRIRRPAPPRPAPVARPPARPAPVPAAAPAAPAPTASLSPPQYRDCPPPPYPRLARRRGLEGTVLLTVLVAADGAVQEITVQRSSGHAVLDRQAVETVGSWRFHPARRGRQAVAHRVEVPVRFQLR
jgi:protein TonB